MKCTFILILFLILPLRVFGEEPIRVVASFYPTYIMALNVAQNVPGVQVVGLVASSTGCLHDYTLTTQDMKKIADAEILVANGAGMESFLDRVIAQHPQVKVITLSEGISLIRSSKRVENPHVWVGISGAIEQVKNLEKGMSQADPAHAHLYQQNAQNYINKLQALQAQMKKELAPYKGIKIITFHEAFPYFAREFDLKIAAVIEREPGSQPSAKELADTIDLIKETGIKVLFSEPQYPDYAIQSIARETGAKVYTLDPVVTGPRDPEAYLNIMTKNLETLKDALRSYDPKEKM